MHIRYVINQHHCDKIKDFPHVDGYLLFYFGEKDKKMFTLPCFQPTFR
jgi:hypothetical protein